MNCVFKKNKCIRCGFTVKKRAEVITRRCGLVDKRMPLLYTNEGNPAFLHDLYKDQHCFFIGAGLSLLQQDLSFLSSRGIISMAVNNIAAKTVKPNLWCCGDLPKSFHRNIWRDGTITKFIPSSNANLCFLDDDKGTPAKPLAGKTANTFQYTRSSIFNHKLFLDEDVISWGSEAGLNDSLGLPGCRSVMFPAIKILYYLGFKYVYLLGCDFNMQKDKSYAFDQYKHDGGVESNNKTYTILNKRLTALQPLFTSKNFNVFNCSPNSKLTAFPQLPLEQAIKNSRKNFPDKTITSGMYGGIANKNKYGW